MPPQVVIDGRAESSPQALPSLAQAWEACVGAIYEENGNWGPFAETFLSLKPRSGPAIPYRHRYLQRCLLRDRCEGRRRRTKRLKMRRGGSTVGEIIPATCYVLTRPNFNVFVGAEDIHSAQTIVIDQIIKPIILNLPDVVSKVVEIEVVKRELRVNHPGLGTSRIYVGGMRDESIGLGYDIHYAVLTEAGYISAGGWKTWDDLIEAVPEEGYAVYEGTANGVGNEFYNRYFSNRWHRQFFPWWTREDAVLGPDSDVLDEPDLRHLRGQFGLNEHERQLQARYGISLDQFRFYRWKMVEKGDLVHEEYPETPEEAFISGSVVTFPAQQLQALYNAAPPVLEPQGSWRQVFVDCGWRPGLLDEADGLRLWKLPEIGHGYAIGIDSATAEGADRSSVQVLDLLLGEQVAVLRGHYAPSMLTDMAVKLARAFNGAHIVPERNGIGAAVCDQLQNVHHYENSYRPDPDRPVGFNMTRDRKMELFGQVEKALLAYNLKLNDRETIREMLRFRVGKGGRLEAPEGQHDDNCMALMLAYRPRAQGQTGARRERRRASFYAAA